jgi:regulator of PEP synthase PpsR (kinase-PPPase family)
MKRSAFFVSDGTGITAENLGKTLLSQFPQVQFEMHTLPFINDPDKSRAALEKIREWSTGDDGRPIIVCTIIHPEVRSIIKAADALVIDTMNDFLMQLETELKHPTELSVGRAHAIAEGGMYQRRMEAVHFALDNDDGATTKGYDSADLILIGVSRSGKTPSCLYMALQFGIRAANYPLTEEDMETGYLPRMLKPYRHKLFGLTIDPERLSVIRNERKPNSRYASLRQCQAEIREVESIYRRERLPCLSTTKYSVEEISSRIIDIMGLKRTAP